MSSFIITPQELAENFEKYVILDCRAELSDQDWGKNEYLKEHIKGSHFVDGEKVLTGELGKHGGRHPFPDMEKFRKTIESLGVSTNSKVAIYGLFGARATFMLRLFGIKAGFISGDIKTLKVAGISFDTFIPKPEKGEISESINLNFLTSMKNVRENLNTSHRILVDSRSPERFSGEDEPIDPIAGHIPGAVNYPWGDILKEDGTVLNETELQDHFSIDSSKDIVLYCGSGVTACFNWLALNQIGIKCSIYAGSWSDWISHKDNLDLISSGE